MIGKNLDPELDFRINCSHLMSDVEKMLAEPSHERTVCGKPVGVSDTEKFMEERYGKPKTQCEVYTNFECGRCLFCVEISKNRIDEADELIDLLTSGMNLSGSLLEKFQDYQNKRKEDKIKRCF